MRGTSLDVKPLAFSSAKLAWRRVMPCMRQIITWLLAEVFNSLSSYRVVWLKARVSQNSETASFALIKVWFIFQLVMSLSFYNNMFCNEIKDTRTVSFCDTSASISQFFQTTAIICYYIRQWKNLKKNWSNKMLFRSGSKILYIRFFLGFDAHGPCVRRYTRAPFTLLRGAETSARHKLRERQAVLNYLLTENLSFKSRSENSRALGKRIRG